MAGNADPVVAIPVSLIGTFAVMQAFGFSLNMLTLFGLVLSVGIVVDDAIVVVENVERKLKEGASPLQAAFVSMDEVGTALVAIALVLLAVFMPTAFIGGITGQFYRQFSVTIATATAISAVPVADAQPGALRAAVQTTRCGPRQRRAADGAGACGFPQIRPRLRRHVARLRSACAGLARIWKPVLIGYVLLLAFAGWFRGASADRLYSQCSTAPS